MATYDGSSWTETNTKRLPLGLIIESESSGSGGGGKTSSAPMGVM